MDGNIQLAVLTSRLEHLERQHRRMKQAVASALLLVVAGVALGAGQQQPPADVIKAKAFTVVDGTGRTIAILGADSDGQPGLSIKDLESGKERMWLGLW